MHLTGLLRELVIEMRIRKQLHKVATKKADKEGIPYYDPIVILNWHKYMGLREFTARFYDVAERRIEKIVDNKDIFVTTEAEMNRITEMMDDRF